jgi:hypothetical protein
MGFTHLGLPRPRPGRGDSVRQGAAAGALP